MRVEKVEKVAGNEGIISRGSIGRGTKGSETN